MAPFHTSKGANIFHKRGLRISNFIHIAVVIFCDIYIILSFEREGGLFLGLEFYNVCKAAENF